MKMLWLVKLKVCSVVNFDGPGCVAVGVSAIICLLLIFVLLCCGRIRDVGCFLLMLWKVLFKIVVQRAVVIFSMMQLSNIFKSSMPL